MTENLEIIEVSDLYRLFISFYKSLKIRNIIVILVVSGLLGYLIACLDAKYNKNYKATYVFALEQQGLKSSPLGGLASQFGVSLSAESSSLAGENLLKLMQSQKVIENALLKPMNDDSSVILVNYYIENNSAMKRRWLKEGLYPISIFDWNQRQDSAFGYIVEEVQDEMLSLSKDDRELNFVEISVTSRLSTFSEELSKNILDEALRFYVNSKTRNSMINILNLQRRVDSVSAELEKSLVSLTEVQENNIFLVNQVAKVPGMKAQVKVSMLTTLYGELVKNLELAKTLAVKEEPVITIVDEPRYPLLVQSNKLVFSLFSAIIGLFAYLFWKFVFFEKVKSH
jgi:hypothetical protein